MREADRRTITDLGIPGFTLMEVAGRAVADEALFLLEDDSPQRVVCLCGRGNNGGDGFVAARVLHQAGVDVEVFLFTSADELSGDAKKHYDILAQVAENESGIRVESWLDEASVVDVSGIDLIIDAILGTGLSSSVREPLASVISWVNGLAAPVLSVDLPSGLSADTGSRLGVCINADVTVTLGALKTGLVIGDGPDFTGAIIIADIGIPYYILEDVAGADFEVRFCQHDAVESILPVRARSDHKYASGPALVVGGSDRYTGAPVLAATAAARMGSGYVGVATPEAISQLVAEKLTEIPVTPMRGESPEASVSNMISDLGNRWDKSKALLVGPGMGREPETKELILNILERSKTPVVIDADGLVALVGEKKFVQSRSNGTWVFTPHAGEFAQLNGSEGTPTLEELVAFSSEWNVILLMKGMPSLTISPTGEVVINNTGNPAAATAGSGDVLSGMIAGLIAQGLAPFDAAVGAIHLAGAVADRYATDFSPNSMMAGDVLNLLPTYLSDPG